MKSRTLRARGTAHLRKRFRAECCVYEKTVELNATSCSNTPAGPAGKTSGWGQSPAPARAAVPAPAAASSRSRSNPAQYFGDLLVVPPQARDLLLQILGRRFGPLTARTDLAESKARGTGAIGEP